MCAIIDTWHLIPTRRPIGPTDHGIAEVLQALVDAGLRIDQIEEYDALELEARPVNQLGEDGMFRLREGREPASVDLVVK